MTKRMRGTSVFVLLGTFVFGESAIARGLLDYIRSYDLNDYALGVSISVEQSSYIGSENSVFAYPYLTSFRDSAFTDDWLLIREGDVGIRWVSKSNWELGLIGRIQTLGLGTSDAPELRGLDDRNWGLELAPIIGWRGWPVHINLKAYTEILGNHDGSISQLAFSLPHESERGYLIPSVEFIYQSKDYADYYYGVSPSESGPFRAAYQVGDALNTALKVRWGYEVTKKWLLSGSVCLEFLDSAISSSPIVGEDEIWSANISVAYNNDIFESRVSERAGGDQPSFELRFGAFSDSIDSTIIRDSSVGVNGTDINLESFLGLPDKETILQFDAIFRITTYHRLELGYFETARSGLTTLQDPVTFGDEQFAAGTTVNSSFDTKLLRFGYAYLLINDAQKELGIMGGLHYSRFNTQISAEATGQLVITKAATPLPVIGMHGSVALGQKATLGARIQFFRLDFDRYEGSLSYITLDLQRRFGDNYSIGVAYNYYAMNLDSRDNDVRGSLKIRHQGPVLFVSVGF